MKNLDKKDRRILKNMGFAFVIKGAGLVVSLFTMPAYLSFFQDDAVLGLWFTLLSVLSWVLYFDLGIGNGLRNHLTQALTQGRKEEARRYLASAYAVTGLICLLAAVIFWPLRLTGEWNRIFAISPETVSPEALGLTVGIVFTGILVQLFLKLICPVLYALQLPFVNDVLSLCTSVLTLLAVLRIPSGNREQNLVVMALTHALAVALPLAVCTVWIFCRGHFRFSFWDIRMSYARKVLGLGGRFFLVQIAYMLILNTNEYGITVISGPEYVVEYQIYSRIFLQGSTLFSLAMTPVWSEVTGAMAEKNYLWVRALYQKLCRFGVVAAVCEFAILPAVPWLLNVWLGQTHCSVYWTGAFWMAAMGAAVIWNSVVSSIANGLGLLGTQMVCFFLGAAGKFLLAPLLGRQSWVGVAAATVLVLLPYCLVQHIALKRFFQQQEVCNE